MKPTDAHGWLAADYDTQLLGVASRERVWWRCLCETLSHVTYKAPRSVSEKRQGKTPGEPLWCHRCYGTRPTRGIAATLTEDEKQVWGLLERNHPEALFAVHVELWDECKKSADIFLPEKRIIIEVDGRSHFEAPMPQDRKGDKGQKWVKDVEWDGQARREGFKVLRLHYKDANEWAAYIQAALDAWLDKSPVYTPTHPRAQAGGA